MNEKIKWYESVSQTGVLGIFFYGIGLVVAYCNHEPIKFYVVIMIVCFIGIVIGTIFEYRDMKHEKIQKKHTPSKRI